MGSKILPCANQGFVRKEVGAASREEYKQKHGVDYVQGICLQLWDQPQINWDGKMLGCSRNFWGDFGGNAFKDGLLNSINNEKIKYARDMLLGKKVARADIPCTTCNIYLGMKADGKWQKRRLPSYRALRFIYRSFGLHRLRQRLKKKVVILRSAA